MGCLANLIGKNSQETIKNYAHWSSGWLKRITTDLMVTIDKLQLIVDGMRSNNNDSVEHKVIYELLSSTLQKLKNDYYENISSNNPYYILKNILDNNTKIIEELEGDKPVEITTSIFNNNEKPYIVRINGDSTYFRKKLRGCLDVASSFYYIDERIHNFFNNKENPFEIEFTILFSDKECIEYLTTSYLDKQIFSPNNPKSGIFRYEIQNTDKVNILENLKFNYPKIKFEYIEDTTKEFDISKNEI